MGAADDRLQSSIGQLPGLVTRIGELLIDLLVMAILIMFISTDIGWAEKIMRGWLPAEHHRRALRVADRLAHRLSRWVWAQAALATYLGVAYGIGLSTKNPARSLRVRIRQILQAAKARSLFAPGRHS